MSAERLYGEHEIAEIFKQAAEAQDAAQHQLSHSEGLTLAELQQIGKEAGITPAFIARAAAAVGQTGPSVPPTTFLGLPVSVARTVDLPGPFSDEDWDRLVVDLRSTFHATGKVQRDGSLRQWRNGNLHALVEPTESGHRLYLRTRKGNAKSALLTGLGGVGMGLALMLMTVLAGDFIVDLEATFISALFVVMGLGSIGLTAYRLPRWVEERGHQMEAIAGRAAQRATAPPVRSLGEPVRSLGEPEEALADAASAAHERRAGQTRT